MAVHSMQEPEDDTAFNGSQNYSSSDPIDISGPLASESQEDTNQGEEGSE